MNNDHVATPFREILASIVKPHPLPIELPVKEQPQTRFHPDDIATAFGVLLWYWPANQDANNADERMREAFSRALVSLDAAMTRREMTDLEAMYLYEQGRK